MRILLALLLLAAAAPTLAAQEAPALDPGTRVHVLTERGGPFPVPLVGTLRSAGPDTLVVLRGRERHPYAVPVESVQRLSVSTGRTRRTGRFAGVGAAAGGLALGAAAVIAEHGCTDYMCVGPGVAFTAGSLLGGLGGALLGAAVGFHSPAERWVPVPHPVRSPPPGRAAPGSGPEPSGP